jgi:hypothetical protein
VLLYVTCIFVVAQAIKKETSWHFEDALLAVVQCTCYPARFFAQVHFCHLLSSGVDCYKQTGL